MATYACEWDQAGDGTFSEDISGYVMDVHTDRGRKTDLETMPPGYATLILNNADGRFSPDKAAGAYYPDVEMYRRVRIKVDHSATDYGLFWGWILGWDNKPKTTEQTVTWFLGDRFALMQDMALSLPLLQRLPVKCALDLALNRAAGNNECTNPSVETDLTDYSGLQAVTPVRDPSMKIEGDYAVFCDCPGDNAGEGWQYDATGQVTHSKPIIAQVWARASATVTLKFQARDSVSGVLASTTASVGTTPTLLSFTEVSSLFAEGSDHYFDLITNGASEVMFWSDGLYFVTPANAALVPTRDLDDGTAEIELAAAYRQPALEVLQAIAESEPRSFFFPYCGNTSYDERLRFRDKDYRAMAGHSFGKKTVGDTGTLTAQDAKLGCKYTLAANTVIYGIYWYGRGYSGTIKAKCMIYNDDAGDPDTLEATTNEVTGIDNVTPQWYYFVFSTPVSLSAGDYWLATIIDDASGFFYWDSGDVDQTWGNADTYEDGPADPFGAKTISPNYALSIFAYAPVATFSDDGADIPYHDLVLGEDAIDRISEVEVVSQGDYLDENEEVTVWELSPTGQLVAATETINYRARYSQPARDCSLVLSAMAETFLALNDGYGGYTKATWPPDVWQANEAAEHMKIGSYYIGDLYGRFRTYLRFNTAGIPDGATVNSAKLRLRLRIDLAKTAFTLNVRDKDWLTDGLTEADWSAVPGGDDLVGSMSTADLPPAEQWFEIDLGIAYINKTGNTEFCLSSSREEAATQPTGFESIDIYSNNAPVGYQPQLVVNYDGLDQGSSTFANYGVGADISITAGASPLYVTAVEVKGKPLKGTSEESKVIAAAPSPPPIDRTLSVALPLQGSRTASMETEATRLAARYDGRIRRPALVLRPKTDAVLTQMLVREIGDLIHVENIGSAYGTWIDQNFWIEGISHDFQPGGEHETVFYLEEE